VQLIDQDLRLLEIERVEAFGELILDQSEEFAGRSWLALVAPEPRYAHRRVHQTRRGGRFECDALTVGRPHFLRAFYPQFHISPMGVQVQHGPKLPPL
jgi:hypothetical protein